MSSSVAPDGASPHEFLVENEQAGQRLDVYLAAQLNVSRGRAQSLVKTATVNGSSVKAKYAVKSGDRVVVAMPEQEPTLAVPQWKSTEVTLPPILFEDDHLLVINKPRDLVVHAGAGETGATLVEILQVHGRTLSSVGPSERAGIVHRLDKDTTGLIVFCKTDEAHWKLAADFAERRVQKNYLALVCGVPPKRARIEAPIGRHPRDRKKMKVVPDGRNAITEYALVQNWQKFAQLDVDLLTGRTHQIRVHLSYINHPVVGDAVYGGEKRAIEASQTPEVRGAIESLGGQALHAARLQFVHPVTGEEMNFEAPLPEDYQRVLDALGQE